MLINLADIFFPVCFFVLLLSHYSRIISRSHPSKRTNGRGKRSLNSEAMGRTPKTTETARKEAKEDIKEFKFAAS